MDIIKDRSRGGRIEEVRRGNYRIELLKAKEKEGKGGYNE
jgi:hypothetical protein